MVGHMGGRGAADRGVAAAILTGLILLSYTGPASCKAAAQDSDDSAPARKKAEDSDDSVPVGEKAEDKAADPLRHQALQDSDDSAPVGGRAEDISAEHQVAAERLGEEQESDDSAPVGKKAENKAAQHQRPHQAAAVERLAAEDQAKEKEVEHLHQRVEQERRRAIVAEYATTAALRNVSEMAELLKHTQVKLAAYAAVYPDPDEESPGVENFAIFANAGGLAAFGKALRSSPYQAGVALLAGALGSSSILNPAVFMQVLATGAVAAIAGMYFAAQFPASWITEVPVWTFWTLGVEVAAVVGLAITFGWAGFQLLLGAVVFLFSAYALEGTVRDDSWGTEEGAIWYGGCCALGVALAAAGKPTLQVLGAAAGGLLLASCVCYFLAEIMWAGAPIRWMDLLDCLVSPDYPGAGVVRTVGVCVWVATAMAGIVRVLVKSYGSNPVDEKVRIEPPSGASLKKPLLMGGTIPPPPMFKAVVSDPRGPPPAPPRRPYQNPYDIY